MESISRGSSDEDQNTVQSQGTHRGDYQQEAERNAAFCSFPKYLDEANLSLKGIIEHNEVEVAMGRPPTKLSIDAAQGESQSVDEDEDDGTKQGRRCDVSSSGTCPCQDELSSLTGVESIHCERVSSSSESSLSSSSSCSTVDTGFLANGQNWNPNVEGRRRVVVRASFGQQVAHILRLHCPVGVANNEEVAVLDVDIMARALEQLMNERQEFIDNVLELLETTNRVNVASMDLVGPSEGNAEV